MALSGGLFLFVTAAQAATFSVTSAADAGPGSLREAIIQANSTPGRDLIEARPFVTVTLLSPLPPITEAVDINTDRVFLTGFDIDGTSAGAADGLVVNANDVSIENVGVFNFNGDALVLHGDNASIFFCHAGSRFDGTSAPNRGAGLLITGRRNKVETFYSDNNGIGFRISGSDNEITGAGAIGSRTIGIWIERPANGNSVRGIQDFGGFGVPGIAFQIDKSGTSGALVEGSGNTLGTLEFSGSGGDGVVVSGSGNYLFFDNSVRNAGNGFTLLSPVRFRDNKGVCNGAQLVDAKGDGPTPNDTPDADEVLNAPVLTSVVANFYLYTVSGTLHSTPSTKFRIEFSGFDSSCRAQGDGPVVVTTDPNGLATFRHAVAMNRGITRVGAIATRLRADGTAEVGSSELSNLVTPVIDADLRADLIITATAPAAVAEGQEFTIEYRIENSGPSALSFLHTSFITPTGAVALGETTENTESTESFAPGQVYTVHRRLRATGAAGTMIRDAGSAYGSSPTTFPDPDLSNNTASVQIAIVASAAVPALSFPALALLAACLAAAGMMRSRA